MVLDTAAFLAGLEGLFEKAYTTPLVIEEVKDLHSKARLEMALSGGKVVILFPSRKSMSEVRAKAESLGEKGLSEADLSVAALALELGDSIVFTDDLALQNLLASLGISYSSVKLKVKLNRVKKVVYVCPSCNREYSSPGTCEFCGSVLRRKAVK
ncbi:MAG: NOB1 family endonuclease [Thermoprotei archaeon]